MDPGPTILHADLDAFYASVEQMLRPELRGLPIAVGGGVVLACSYEAKRFGVEVLTMPDWRAVFDLHLDSPLYLTFDMDCLDPAFAPGISHREPGGLSTRKALSIIQALKANLIGADLVEFNPTQDVSDVTAMVAAKVFKEIAAKMLEY